MSEFAQPQPVEDDGLKRAGVGVRLLALDMSMVEAAARSTRRPILRAVAITFTKLGNGWIYPAIAAAIVLRWGVAGLRIIAAALATAGILHLLYPRLKRRFLRARPFVANAGLQSLAKPLDLYSCPSGHTMTLTGVFVPLIVFWHAAWPAGMVMGLGLAWSRLATAHHYPSDVLAGAVLGVCVGLPVAALAAWLW